ncbi:hypothetical protein GE21DRAFT_1206678 [Neurospora crassa]|nr:hypothetical protein B7F21.90 [imported] - Neurospora crassa [Neurospora crassa]KHE85292.1 hypothetical protein GE21DRAFT_1206678 [Neurospora crassa]
MEEGSLPSPILARSCLAAKTFPLCFFFFFFHLFFDFLFFFSLYLSVSPQAHVLSLFLGVQFLFSASISRSHSVPDTYKCWGTSPLQIFGRASDEGSACCDPPFRSSCHLSPSTSFP